MTTQSAALWLSWQWPRNLAIMAGGLLPFMLCAQSQRDPTLPPPSALDSSAGDKPAEAGPMTVIVRDGRPYLVVGTRLYAQGQKLGEARIERIGETEIWLREGKVLRKLARYTGVQRSPAAPAGTTSDCPAPEKKAPRAKTATATGIQQASDACARRQP